MGCAPSSPTHEEQAFVEGRSPFFIKESLQAVEKTPGGSQKKVKKYRKKLVPRLKSTLCSKETELSLLSLLSQLIFHLLTL